LFCDQARAPAHKHWCSIKNKSNPIAVSINAEIGWRHICERNHREKERRGNLPRLSKLAGKAGRQTIFFSA
jgi:hypothetical protein